MLNKHCPNLKCQEPLVSLPSLNIRICSGCKAHYDWSLEPGQKSIYIEGLVGTDDKHKTDYKTNKE
jgi:hypothetical protein